MVMGMGMDLVIVVFLAGMDGFYFLWSGVGCLSSNFGLDSSLDLAS